ncbi:MAG: TrmH family RNA methyltransferase [Flavobacteriales bacterium]
MTGLSKNKIKWIRSLQQKKVRDDLELFIVEGEKMVLEAVDLFPNYIDSVYYIDGSLNLPESLDSTVISEKELEQISGLKTPNKAIAVLKKPISTYNPVAEGLTIVLDGIQDPGNFGTILRIADWFGIEDVICSNNTVECYNPKVVQASMGAILRINIHYCELSVWLSEIKKPVYGALLQGESVYSTDLPKNAVLIVGNEGKGISSEIQKIIEFPIKIPRFGRVESLNVSVAAGILVSEFKRR